MNSRMTLDDAAKQVAMQLEKRGKIRGIDPAFLAFLMDLLMEFLPVLLDICKETTETVPNACREMRRGRPFRYWFGARRVRRSVGRPLLRSMSLNSFDLLDAMLEVGATTEPDQVQALYNECRFSSDD